MLTATFEAETVQAIPFDGTWEGARAVQTMGVACGALEDATTGQVWLTFLTPGRGLTIAGPGQVVVRYPDNSWVVLHPETFAEMFEVES